MAHFGEKMESEIGSTIERILNSSTPFEVLDISEDANAALIKDKYRKLALLLHPDKHNGKVIENEVFTIYA